MASTKEFVARVRGELAQTFRSLRHPDFLMYSGGQLISLTGSWMQQMALAWITYSLTHSALFLGLVGLFTNVPVLLLSLFGGMVADRYNRRRVLIMAQWASMASAAILTALVVTDSLQVWMILALAVVSGIITAFEVPSRQAIVSDLVHGEDMVNAISVNSVIFNTTRMFGPAIGAFLLGSFGAEVCFALNTLSFLAAIYTLRRLTIEQKQESAADKRDTPISEGLRFAWGNAEIRNILILTSFTSFFGFQFATLLPVFVSDVFHASAGALGLLSAASAMGALGGSLFLANRGKPSELHRNICVASIGLAVSLFLFAMSPNLYLSAFIEVFIGLSISVQLNSSNSLLQLTVPNAVRGRVLSMYTMILLGAVPFGSVVIGKLTDSSGAPLAVAVCAVACAGAAVYYVLRGRKDHQ
jgi:MFS family permease